MSNKPDRSDGPEEDCNSNVEKSQPLFNFDWVVSFKEKSRLLYVVFVTALICSIVSDLSTAYTSIVS